MFPKPPKPDDLAGSIALQRRVGHAIKASDQRRRHFVARASQAHVGALLVRLRKQRIELLEVLALVERHRRARRRA